MKKNWYDKKILVLGLSKSGISAAKYLNKKGAEVFITELREQKEEDIQTIKELNELNINVEMGGHSDGFIKDSYLAVTSPGIPPSADIFQKLKEENINVISEVELAYEESQKPFIAITGTNGKTTTTALTAHILQSDYKAFECGNIGTPPCDLLEKAQEGEVDYFVCEMSSFQIATSHTFQAQIACWLNFTPDHLDWHGGIDNYFEAKAKLFKLPQLPIFAIFNGADKKLLDFSKTCQGEVFLFALEAEDNCCWVKNEGIYFKRNKIEEKIIDIKDCPIIGEHNLQNIMCAVIVAKLTGVGNDKIKTAIMDFKAPEHRLEKVCEYNNITFYNDSKATNPEAAIVAIKSFNNVNAVLIAGGRDKNTDLAEFCEAVKAHIKTVILIGEASNRFEENLKKNGFDNIIFEKTLEGAIDKSIELRPQVVLLSPACASYDMFKSYEERGMVFKEYARSKIQQ